MRLRKRKSLQSICKLTDGLKRGKPERFETSKMDLLGVGGIGSKVVEFLETHEKFVLQSCSHHLARVVNHPTSWSSSETIRSQHISHRQLMLALNRKSLQSVTFDISKFTVRDKDKSYLLLEKLAEVMVREDCQFDPPEVVIVTGNRYSCTDLLTTLGKWNRNIRILKLRSSSIHSPNHTMYLLRSFPMMHTIDVMGRHDVFVQNVLDDAVSNKYALETLRYHFDRNQLIDDTSVGFFSRIPLSTVEIGCIDDSKGEMSDEIEKVYESLNGSIVTSLRSCGTSSIWKSPVMRKFVNLSHVMVTYPSEIVDAIKLIPKLERVTFRHTPSDGTVEGETIGIDVEAFTTLLETKVPDSITIEVELLTSSDPNSTTHGVDINPDRSRSILESVAKSKGKVVVCIDKVRKLYELRDVDVERDSVSDQ